MSLFNLPLWQLIPAVLVMALATAGMYATMRSIPDALQGVYRMHIYAPPAAAFIFFAAFIVMIAPFAGLIPATDMNVFVSKAVAIGFAAVGYISLKRGGYAALS